MKRRLAAKRLRELLDYDPETGRFYWRKTHGRMGAAREAGSCVGHGYRRIKVDNVGYYAHRLAWLYVHGRQPRGNIDHINGIRADNRIGNLRDDPRGRNMRNVSTCGASGFKGVVRHGSGWRARIMVDGKTIDLGVYDSPEEAAAVYDKAARRYHGKFARTNADIAAARIRHEAAAAVET